MNRSFGALLEIFLICGGWATASEPVSAGTQDSVKTTFSVLVGYPSNEQKSGGGALLVPGSVIPLTGESVDSSDIAKRQVIEKSLAFSKAAENLWNTFRLDPSRQRQQGKSELAIVGKPIELPQFEDANIRITAALLRYDNTNATFRVLMRQGEKSLADSTVGVVRGGRTVVGGMDGTAAPYIFVFIEPEPPGKEDAGAQSGSHFSGITEPKIVLKVPPEYPVEAKKEKASGVVVLDLIIGTDGAILDISALENPDPRLTQAAITAVKQWKFEPALDAAGKPVKVHTTITVRFQLR